MHGAAQLQKKPGRDGTLMPRLRIPPPLLAAILLASATSLARAQTLSTISSFDSSIGGNPYGTPVLDGSTLYGTLRLGGPDNVGGIYSVPMSGGTPTVLGYFNGSDGSQIQSSLTRSGSTLYGTSSAGGANGDGTIFSMPLSGGTPAALFNFDNGAVGGEPRGNLNVSPDGSTLYGMAMGGTYGDGTIFSIPTAGGSPTVLGSFNGTDGEAPFGGLTLVGSTLYGMTHAGTAGANDEGEISAFP